MLKVSNPVQNKLCLVLKISYKVTTDTICKGLVISEVCPEKILKFRLSDWDLFCSAMLIFMLLLGYYIMQKQGSKKDMFGPTSFGGFKTVLTLLIKAITV